MKESEFRSLAEKAFLDLEDELDNYNWDFNFDNQGDIFIISSDSEEYMVLTKNFSHKEIWLVAGKDAFHFKYDGQDWVSSRNKNEIMFDVIRDYLNIFSGER